jgi:hypothetical protein
MKWINPVLVLSIIISSCSQSAVSKKLSGSDSLVINFNKPDTDSIIKTVTTTEKNAIRKVIHFVDGKETEKLKCGFDGILVFYKQGIELPPIVFKYKKNDCRHFLMEVDGKVLNIKMSREAADFLQSLEENRTWY